MWVLLQRLTIGSSTKFLLLVKFVLPISILQHIRIIYITAFHARYQLALFCPFGWPQLSNRTRNSMWLCVPTVQSVSNSYVPFNEECSAYFGDLWSNCLCLGVTYPGGGRVKPCKRYYSNSRSVANFPVCYKILPFVQRMFIVPF
jgi:hypothetical protein